MVEFKRKPIEGVFVLMPLCLKENQEIDYQAIAWNIEWLEDKGIPGFIQFGCMGQMNAPSEEEFNKVCDVCVKTARGKKIAAVISSTSTNTREVIRRATYAENAGADGSMLALPYAFPVIEEWAVEFYESVDKALKGDLALMPYNIPQLTGFNLTPTLWREHLLNIKSIKALKESHRETRHHDRVLITIADKVNFFSPETFFLHDSMLGGKGIIGVLSWVAPRVMVKWYKECGQGNQKSEWTLKVWKALVSADEAMRSPKFPPSSSYEHGYLNALAEIGGAKAGPPRKPYGSLPQPAKEALRKVLSPLIEMEKELK